jgi:poly(3-hydroxybutyrate) depolymerase
MRVFTTATALRLALLSLLLPHPVLAAAPLPVLNIAPSEVTVSGLSSGAFMAVQLHIGYSETFRKGVAAVGGGPFYCAENRTFNALVRCRWLPAWIPTEKLVIVTRQLAATGAIDPPANLRSSRVFLFSGQRDDTVKTGVVDALARYYASFVAPQALAYRKDVPAGHGMVTDQHGNRCATSEAPYINNCGLDLAGLMLQHLYGPLQPRSVNPPSPDHYLAFDQRPFAGLATSLGDTGWVYIPAACQPGAARPCRLHVALHGCRQNTGAVQESFVKLTGYNRWADTNAIVVLYPQTGPRATNACWDWWGYESPYYATRRGPQMMAIKAMVDRLTGRPATR